MKGRHIDRLIDGIELTAGLFLAVITALMFVSVFLRYLFAWSLPDANDIGCLLLGIIIFWGMAGAGYRGDHITVDLVWNLMGRRLRRAVDLLACLVTLGAMAVFTWMGMTKVLSTRDSNVLTFDTQMPVWIFYLVAWAGLAASTLLLLIRAGRLVVRPEALAHDHISAE